MVTAAQKQRLHMSAGEYNEFDNGTHQHDIAIDDAVRRTSIDWLHGGALDFAISINIRINRDGIGFSFSR